MNIGRWPKGKLRLANFGLMDQVAGNNSQLLLLLTIAIIYSHLTEPLTNDHFTIFFLFFFWFFRPFFLSLIQNEIANSSSLDSGKRRRIW